MIRQLTNPRELRGLAILSQPESIIQINKNEWDVHSQSKNAYYRVLRLYKDRHAIMRGQAEWRCTCPDYTTRNVICKHIHAVQLSLKIAGDVHEQSIRRQLKKPNQRLHARPARARTSRSGGSGKQRLERTSDTAATIVDTGLSLIRDFAG